MDSTDIFAIAVVLTIGGTMLAIILGILWWLGARRIALAERLVATTGTLHEIALEERQGNRGSRYWVIRSRYDYQAGGATLQGTRPALEFNSFTNQNKALQVIGDLRPGQRVTVWYDPQKPKTAVLNKTPPANMRLYRVLAIIGIAAAIAGVAGIASYAPVVANG
ncbi:MAG TPA: DUF3592 domain-containing protein [Bauldia sp.]|nr:DUF3592 domain-containing protein [Bauldia sp.]